MLADRLPKPIFPRPPATKLTERWAQWAWQAPLAWITAHTILSQWLDKTDGLPWSPDSLLGSGSYASLGVGRAIIYDSDGAGRFLPVNPSIPLYYAGTNPATSKSKTLRRSGSAAQSRTTVLWPGPRKPHSLLECQLFVIFAVCFGECLPGYPRPGTLNSLICPRLVS